MRYCRIEAGVVFETIEADALPTAPGLLWAPDPAGTVEQGWTFDGSNFTAPAPDLDAHRVAKVVELTQAFEVELASGFNSDALGSTHRYDSEAHNRENLIGAVAAGAGRPFTCDDLQGSPTSKQQRAHTAVELSQVLQDGATVKDTLIAKLRGKRADVAAAGTVEAIDAVTWA